MPVTFKSPAHGDITYLREVAEELIRLMGHSGTIPGALAAEDVPRALARLRAGLRVAGAPPPSGAVPDSEDDEDPPVPIAQRALPLLALLEAAEQQGEYVLWDAH
ncbi:hypothetical protein B1C78_11225 [Thioalkalivibrio denitrificans]|uniref:DUF1840 domain-containing protein n=1 Tax=Thioalkalivibrio denitrificans TaxID=108003 RepID=A0A1V3NEH6_9GAMM|nr:DUF1840 domain-containing protein [Thioalkalivibrio denitrificans]OOG23497.1 hypothetical protein B1C78_11225 [Thioalkalivibrio denitrificans]